MTYITWFDPGVRTGVVTGWFNATSHYEPRTIRQIEGGIVGLEAWLDQPGTFVPVCTAQVWADHIVGSEKFIPRPIEGGSHTLDSTLPLVGEGVLIGRGIMPPYPQGNWQPATAQVLSGGDTPEERKKNSDDLLKAHGLWLTGADVGQDDADDAISATKHILHYLIHTARHRPTRDWLYGEETQ